LSADSNAQIVDREIYRHDLTGGWRMALRVRRLDEGKPWRWGLRSGKSDPLETWSYLLPPELSHQFRLQRGIWSKAALFAFEPRFTAVTDPGLRVT